MKNIRIYISPTYKKELKKLKRKNYPVELISICLKAILENDTSKLRKMKHHQLKGKWKGYNEFHPSRIGNFNNSTYDQWIVVYSLNHNELILTLVTTGDHKILDKHAPSKI
ncbi:type II toxin-antitoxin system YafQ family toxin [Lactobacillus johnsonii]|uniref:type II toxin-antitoxin system YafQ family toxin n=2 Tax=Lactobacillus johnsonii TaxID=33959 RepID=UPI0021B5388B|nr:type II toxin-antitoxin system YafQ family toxin [Lactobacillus johnsonii]